MGAGDGWREAGRTGRGRRREGKVRGNTPHGHF